MINKIVGSYILFACLFAVALKLGGVDSTIHFGTYFQSYLVQSNRELVNFRIAIPLISKIDPINPYDGITLGPIENFWDALQYVKYAWVTAVVNMRMLGIMNGIADFLNILIQGINTIIQTIELVFIFLKNIIVMKDSIVNANA